MKHRDPQALIPLSFSFTPPTTARFILGEIRISNEVIEEISEDKLLDFLKRHANGIEWIDPIYQNYAYKHRVGMGQALKQGEQLISIFEGHTNFPVWLITSANRKETHIVTPAGD